MYSALVSLTAAATALELVDGAVEVDVVATLRKTMIRCVLSQYAVHVCSKKRIEVSRLETVSIVWQLCRNAVLW